MQKNTDAGQMNEGEEARCELVKAHGNTAELLEIEEEGFHKLAFLVQPPIHVSGVGIIRCRQDTEIRVMFGDELAKFPLAIGSVGEDGRSSEINLADQFFATVMSAVLPVVSRIAMGLPKASTAA